MMRTLPCCFLLCRAVLCQVIDDQVDALAANAVKALGSLWGGLNTVAKTSWGLTTDITKKVRASMVHMSGRGLPQ